MTETCAAHELLVKNVEHLRDNQGQIYDLIREVSKKQGEQDTQIALLSTKVDTGFEEIQGTQKQILSMLGKRKWTTNKMIALASALFGSGSLGYALVVKVFNAE